LQDEEEEVEEEMEEEDPSKEFLFLLLQPHLLFLLQQNILASHSLHSLLLYGLGFVVVVLSRIEEEDPSLLLVVGLAVFDQRHE
jgi:hypothetical protein